MFFSMAMWKWRTKRAYGHSREGEDNTFPPQAALQINPAWTASFEWPFATFCCHNKEPNLRYKKWHRNSACKAASNWWALIVYIYLSIYLSIYLIYLSIYSIYSTQSFSRNSAWINQSITPHPFASIASTGPTRAAQSFAFSRRWSSTEQIAAGRRDFWTEGGRYPWVLGV